MLERVTAELFMKTFRIEVGSKQDLSLAGWVSLVVEVKGVEVGLTWTHKVQE